MADFAVKPDEIEFMTKYSNAESEEEKTRLTKEYDAQVEAYLNWLDNVNKREPDRKSVGL